MQGQKKLNKLGIYTLEDLVSYFPRAYDDRSNFKSISQLEVGELACVAATVASTPVLSHIRRGMDIVKLRVVDGAGSLNITFFNQTYMQNNLIPGEGYIFYGKVGGTKNRPEMTNPIVESEKAERRMTGRIVPVYGLTEGISQNVMIKAVEQGIKECGEKMPDPLPPKIQDRYKLARAGFAYKTVHFPKSTEELAVARKRLIFQELFILSLGLSLMRDDFTRRDGSPIKRANMDDFYNILPYKLTKAQLRTIDECLGDMEKSRPMARLVQGDVGSGKTVVAAAACYSAAKSGFQSAMMAPTEILARQHFETLSKTLEPIGVRVGLLVGAMRAKEKREVLSGLENGDIDLIVGTHALLSENVKFSRLGLVITDEQHRFGVDQRAALAEKGVMPHVLVMSATPIPRTLAMIIYGDLDISVIDELPPGRQTIDTFLVGEKMRPRIYSFIRKLVSQGRQVYIVCPMVEESEDGMSDLKSVKAYAEKMRAEFFDLRVELVHGKMKSDEKERVMGDFSRGNTDILIATTVIEVGVDVPNATLMVIENAERFGLSQLHQLRGRVGRGKEKSYCVMFCEGGSELTTQRLKVMTETNDGFKIADEDLKLRGPGDFFGSKQHGLPELKIANFAEDVEILTQAREAADSVISADPLLNKQENRELRKYITKMMQRNANTMN